MTKHFCDSCGCEIVWPTPQGYYVILHWAGEDDAMPPIFNGQIRLCATCNADPDKRNAIIAKTFVPQER